ncbi:MAG: hypothetical protein MUC37_13840 [Hyphomicrobium sp.]|jgi:hypothetical protein|nr:hypothetical protein [Hyphomicrobium sp.]
MFTIIKCSGRHWARAALAWLLFALVIDGLARAGSEAAEAKLAAYNAAVALGVLKSAEHLRPQGQYQVAEVRVSDIDLKQLDPTAFGDGDDLIRPGR